MHIATILTFAAVVTILLVDIECQRLCKNDCDCFVLYGERCVYATGHRKCSHCSLQRDQKSSCFCKRGCMTAKGNLLARRRRSSRDCKRPRITSQTGGPSVHKCFCMNPFNNTMCCKVRPPRTMV